MKNKDMIKLSFESVAENKQELIKELKDLIWRLDVNLPIKSDWLKLNYGERHTRLVNIKEFFKCHLGW
jgi:hypothetical protein